MARDRTAEVSVRRFFVPTLPEVGAELELDTGVRKHVAVLRLALGTRVHLFDGSGRLVEATLVEGGARIERELEIEVVEPTVALILGLPKGSKTDDIVRMTTELGVAAVHLASTERSVPEWKPKRLDRLRRIAEEAARQSERLRVPEVHAAAPLAEVIARANGSKYVCWARASARPALGPAPRWLAVGPEGGFTDDELAHMDHAGFERISLGSNVLRVDTAAVAAVAWAAGWAAVG